MSRADTITKLKAVPLFQNCSGRQLRRIAELGQEGSFETGRNVCEEGKFGDEFFVILEGHAEVRKGGRKQGALGPGDYFGEIALLRSSLIERSRRTATVTATEPLRCFRMGARQFDVVLYEQDIAVKMLREVVRRLATSG
jgi:CRP/FNR family transcriptional regulator, cyclic AMP receptor protein